MAAPAQAMKMSLKFRDAKGNTARMLVLIGDATTGAIITDIGTLKTHVAAITNAAVGTGVDHTNLLSYGANATFASIEDGALLSFRDVEGRMHRFKVPAPLASIFMADAETVNPANAGVAAVVTDFQTFVYNDANASAPLTFVGGIRVRRKLRRKLTIWTKDPTLTEPAE